MGAATYRPHASILILAYRLRGDKMDRPSKGRGRQSRSEDLPPCLNQSANAVNSAQHPLLRSLEPGSCLPGIAISEWVALHAIVVSCDAAILYEYAFVSVS